VQRTPDQGLEDQDVQCAANEFELGFVQRASLWFLWEVSHGFPFEHKGSASGTDAGWQGPEVGLVDVKLPYNARRSTWHALGEAQSAGRRQTVRVDVASTRSLPINRDGVGRNSRHGLFRGQILKFRRHIRHNLPYTAQRTGERT
jgi:hypothetical protein